MTRLKQPEHHPRLSAGRGHSGIASARPAGSKILKRHQRHRWELWAGDYDHSMRLVRIQPRGDSPWN